jgi:PAS domain S-box-containing protein
VRSEQDAFWLAASDVAQWQTGDPCVLCDHNGRWLFANNGLARLLGLHSDQLVGCHWGEFDSGQLQEVTWRDLDEGRSAKGWLSMRNLDGFLVELAFRAERTAMQGVYATRMTPCPRPSITVRRKDVALNR